MIFAKRQKKTYSVSTRFCNKISFSFFWFWSFSSRSIKSIFACCKTNKKWISKQNPTFSVPSQFLHVLINYKFVYKWIQTVANAWKIEFVKEQISNIFHITSWLFMSRGNRKKQREAQLSASSLLILDWNKSL